jgi:hypothetical protein
MGVRFQRFDDASVREFGLGCQVTLERIFSSGVHRALVHQGIGDTLCNLA